MKKTLMKILGIIFVLVICIIILWFIVSVVVRQNYNEQFLQYAKDGSKRFDTSDIYVSDIKGLINSAIENNKSGRKITLIYHNTNYTSIYELNKLLSKLDTNKKYSMETKYDDSYIECITLKLHTDEIIKDLSKYEGRNVIGSEVKNLISLAKKYSIEEEKYIGITYYSETNQEMGFYYLYDDLQEMLKTDNLEKMVNLEKEIKNDQEYNINIEKDILQVFINIIIKAW